MIERKKLAFWMGVFFLSIPLADACGYPRFVLTSPKSGESYPSNQPLYLSGYFEDWFCDNSKSYMVTNRGQECSIISPSNPSFSCQLQTYPGNYYVFIQLSDPVSHAIIANIDSFNFNIIPSDECSSRQTKTEPSQPCGNCGQRSYSCTYNNAKGICT